MRAGVWLRIGRENGRSFYKTTLGEQAVDSDWTRVVLEAPQMEDVTELTLGCLAAGTGVAWFDGIQVNGSPRQAPDSPDRMAIRKPSNTFLAERY
jgi:hypothetical protein